MQSLRYSKIFRSFVRFHSSVPNSCQEALETKKHKFLLSQPVLDEKFLLDLKNIESISDNIKLRKGVGDIHLVHDLQNQLKSNNLSKEEEISLNARFQEELKKIPNATHPDVKDYGEHPKVVKYYNEKPEFKHNPLEFSEIAKKLNLLRTEHLGNFAGHRSYFLMNDLAELVS